MLKVKRPVSSKNSTTKIDEWKNDIKNSIKSLYIKNKNDTKLIAQYENALQTLKEEYTLIYKENEELKKNLKKLSLNKKYHLKINENDLFQDSITKMNIMKTKMFSILFEKKEKCQKKLFMKKKKKQIVKILK